MNQYDTSEYLQRQTEMFWLLQLQFMQMEFSDILSTYIAVKQLTTYVPNEHTEKINKIMNDYARVVYSGASIAAFEEEVPCIATHLALQLAGVEE